MCVGHEFSDVEIISKKNIFPNCRGVLPAGARIVFMTRNYWLGISNPPGTGWPEIRRASSVLCPRLMDM